MRIAIAFLLAAFSIAAAAPKKPAPAPLDQLFAELKGAQTPEDAKPIEERIAVLFLQSGSASVDLLMARAAAAIAEGDNDTAHKLLDAVTEVAPSYAEGWHQKAELEIDEGHDEVAMVALQKAVTLNPRHFAALRELGDMLEEYGNKDGALKMYKRALAIDPQLEDAAKHVRVLERDVEGQGI
jgi:tetratricopeptide (TPR) repeat protein